MIKPSIGRVVLVHRLGRNLDASHQVTDLSQPEPALITCVHEDRVINVAGFTQTGEPFALNGIALLQDDDVITEGEAHAYWMPYQKAQAAQVSTDGVAAPTTAKAS